MSEVKRYSVCPPRLHFDGGEMVLREKVVLASDYDALAAQCDEGLEREAELKRLLILAWQGEHIRLEDCKKLDAICNGPAYTNEQKPE